MSNHFFQEIIDFESSNEDLVKLYHLKDSGIYKEIVLFLDDFKPEWRKAKELGCWAPEFILGIMEQFENEERSFCEWLSKMYEEIAYSYENTKFSYQLMRDKVEYSQEEAEIENILYDIKEGKLCKSDYEAQLKKYQDLRDNKIYLSF